MVAAIESHPQLEKYELLEEIGHGGMATVYRARDRRLAREVAIKIIHRHLRENQEVARRFVSEARAVAKLRHPNIVEVYDVGDADDDERYLVMELVRGTTLRKLLSENECLPAEIAIAIALEIASALEHAHASGVIHRDMKPENVLVATPSPAANDDRSTDGETSLIKITDFGIAKLLDAQGVTSTGQVLGSPAHMAPEQIEGGDVSARSDVFGLGVLLYEATVGKLPFDGKNPAQVLRRVLEGSFTPADKARPTVGARVAAVIAKALAHDAAERYAGAAELGAALRDELEIVGFSEPRKELREFLLDPKGYQAEYEKKIVDRLIAVAEKARAERNVPLSAASLNRALAFRPDDANLLSEVASLGRRERLRRNLRSAGKAVAASFVVAGAAFAIAQSGKGSSANPNSAQGVKSRTAPPARAPLPSSKVAAPQDSTALMSKPPPLPRPPRDRTVAPVRPLAAGTTANVRITVKGPQSAIVRFDGQEIDWYGQPKPLPVGPHVFEFIPPNDECCEGPSRLPYEIVAPEDPNKVVQIQGVIKFRPATLELRGPAGTSASCGEHGTLSLGKNRVELEKGPASAHCFVYPPPGAGTPKEIDVPLRPGGTFIIDG